MSELELAWSALINFLAEGLTAASWWQIVLFTLVLTHITIVSVTLFLHRHQAHRALDLHPAVSHFFRFWLWLTTGMVTKEWAAIHRKHHAKCDQDGDPHSPQILGIRKVFWEGVELYRAEAKNAETLRRYGHGTPDDWIERHLYARHSRLGVSLMLILDVLLFGAAGLAVWAVQMVWIPFWAAGVINGIGHYWGYRNFEISDASTNVFPWGIVVGGEELHNNHHTYPTSAKFSVKPYEFDIGWVYIQVLAKLGLAKPKKVPPKLAFGHAKPVADEHTLEAIVANRYEVMARYARQMRAAMQAEWDTLRAKLGDESALKQVRRWLHRDDDKLPVPVRAKLEQVFSVAPALAKMHAMREELRQLWSNTSLTREQMARELQAWILRAEQSGIDALRDFAQRLRGARLAPTVV